MSCGWASKVGESMFDQQQRRYLNLADKWPSFQLSGLARTPEGSLTLARVPGLADIIGRVATGRGEAHKIAGIVGDDAGCVYLSDPANNCIHRLEVCSGVSQPLGCLCHKTNGTNLLSAPRGLLIGPRRRLYVADSGHHRVLVIHPQGGQVVGTWGQPGACDPPEASVRRGCFNEPWSLAADRSGFVYVLERAGRRVQKFDADGRLVPGFWETFQAGLGDDASPSPTFIATDGRSELLYILDLGRREVLVVGRSGKLQKSFHIDPAIQATGIVVTKSAIIIADAAQGRLWQYNLNGDYEGTSPDYRGPIAALGSDGDGHLLVHTGVTGGVVRLWPQSAFATQGAFLAGPIDSEHVGTVWHRWHVLAEPLPGGVHMQLFTRTGDTVEVGPASESGAKLFPSSDGWIACPQDEPDVLVLNPPGRYLWLGGRLQGDGHASPALMQMQISYPPDTYLRHLPAIYQEDEERRPLLERSLALFESVLGDIEAQIGDLPLLFDPQTAPSGWTPWLHGWQHGADGADPPDWLPWLAGWLALPMEETWSEADARAVIGEAFVLHGQRGTVKGLRRLIKLYTGADVFIEEPARHTALWSLGEASVLGFTTMLAPAAPQGAVLDGTAQMDSSHLVGGEPDGSYLFDDIAHFFRVWIYAAGLRPPCTLTRIRCLLDREKPAHTEYELCVIEPRMRVGHQARIGIDAIVAGPPAGLRLDPKQALGSETALMLQAEDIAGRIGRDAHLGQETLLV